MGVHAPQRDHNVACPRAHKEKPERQHAREQRDEEYRNDVFVHGARSSWPTSYSTIYDVLHYYFVPLFEAELRRFFWGCCGNEGVGV